ncbi:MAG TPA: hypothetical protein DEF00_05370 [Candidatus Taylorbacteria bacterium]|nr:hypothetical protein [Candidatus Taylorbacteria bacterium]
MALKIISLVLILIELIQKPIAIQSFAKSEEKTEQTREVYRGTPCLTGRQATEDKPFFTGFCETTMRNGFNQ